MRTISDRGDGDAFLYVYSCDLTASVQVKIGDLEGVLRDPRFPIRRHPHTFVQATVYCNDRPVGFPVCTSYKPPKDAAAAARQKKLHTWNEWLTLPVKYCELSRDAFVHFTVWDLDSEEDSASSPAFPRRLLAQTSMPLFGRRGVLASGTIDLQLGLSDAADPFYRAPETWKYAKQSDTHIEQLIRLSRQQEERLIQPVPWLEPHTTSRIEDLKGAHKSAEKCLFLVVEMASVKYDGERYVVVYYEEERDGGEPRLVSSLGVESRLTGLVSSDPELLMDNPCEQQHVTMTRRAVVGDVNSRPNTQARARLDAIIKLPASQPLSRDQSDLVWKFRYFLRANRRALPKFARSVNWDHPSEVAHAITLVNDWEPITAEDALELLSPAFPHPEIRAYAVSRLDSASPEQIQTFLPQLVQALKYEKTRGEEGEGAVAGGAGEGEEPEEIGMEEGAAEGRSPSPEVLVAVASRPPSRPDLASFLLDYAASYPNTANFLFWHLNVEEESTRGSDEAISTLYSSLKQRLLRRIDAASITRQMQFVRLLKQLTAVAKATPGKRESKQTSLRRAISERKELMEMNAMKLPLDPRIRVTGVLSERTYLFNSAMMPVRVSMQVHNPPAGADHEYTMIFKEGDDLRQDQLVMQMICLMDALFKKDQLDLRLTPYAILATGPKEGFVQFINNATPLRDVLSRGSIQKWMEQYRPSPGDAFHIEPDAIDNYVRSLAGYSVVCYVLGVGDRHLDNLLLCQNGKLFHVDFGFILGRDPKPMPPPMKLTGEMIAAFGGTTHKNWGDFRRYCDSAFQILRRNANVLLNLFSLMLDAGIPDIAVERDKAVHKVEQRLRLDLSDEQAYQYLLKLIDASCSAKMPLLVDMVHDIKQNLAW